MTFSTRLILPALLTTFPLLAQNQTSTEFFEKNARPLFVEKCQGCHNAKIKSGGLDLSSPEGFQQAKEGGFFGASTDPEKSLLVQALGYEGRIKMPPQGKLSAEKIAGVKEWLATGAAIPTATGTETTAVETPTSLRPVALRGLITEADKKFWSFAPIAHPVPPATVRKDWAVNPIDQFILAKLEKNGMQPSAPAGKTTLLRRTTFDLTGLPPTEKEIGDFLADDSPQAFEKVVDRLLASPRYGERWGREWLDVMRYADSTGSDEDHRYPHAWRYRDYVVDAFNKDMPYNQFVREQLAGDVLAADPKSGVGYRGVVATGFLALGKKALAQKDLPLKRYDVVDDQIDVTAKAFLGLTVTCARCHDHKFDPIATKDYYAMAGIFASTLSYEKGETGDPIQTPLVPTEQYEVFRKQWGELLGVEEKISKILDFDKQAKKDRDKQEAQMPAYISAAYRVYGKNEQVAKVAADTNLDVQYLTRWVDYLKVAGRPELEKWTGATDANRDQVAQAYQEEFKRSAYQYDQDLSWWRQAERSFPSAGKVAGPRPEPKKDHDPFFFATWVANGPIHRSDEDQIAALTPEKASEIRALLAKRAELVRTVPTQEIPMACAVKEGETMPQKVFLRGDYHNLGDPVSLVAPAILQINAPEPAVASKSGRLEFANWLVDANNPLTARVMVNRIWQGHFGDGIVRTPDNFGKLGDRPSNPELLDFLAREFMEGGWSVKKMHRQIMLSSTYRMSAEFDETKKLKDPEDRLISRFPRQRLSIEQIRDAFLAIGGDLDLTMGGTLDLGVGTDGETSSTRISMNPESTNRRSIYLPLRRSNLPTLYMLFDFGDATSPEGKRNPTTVATQALFVMNSPLVDREAEALADRTLAMKTGGDTRRVQELYMQVLDRQPDPSEVDAGLSYIQALRAKWTEIDEKKAWQSFTHALMASNEFIYVY